jgi:hypothetical protein
VESCNHWIFCTFHTIHFTLHLTFRCCFFTILWMSRYWDDGEIIFVPFIIKKLDCRSFISSFIAHLFLATPVSNCLKLMIHAVFCCTTQRSRTAVKYPVSAQYRHLAGLSCRKILRFKVFCGVTVSEESKPEWAAIIFGWLSHWQSYMFFVCLTGFMRYA